MTQWKEGDKVRVVTRPVLAEDRRSQRYYDHMAGLTGTVSGVYGPEEIAIEVEKSTVGNIPLEVHRESTARLRKKFVDGVSEEAKAKLSPEELNFDCHYVLMVRAEDLERA